MSESFPWSVSGTYYEVCSCEAICPCRQVGGRRGGRSTYGVCDFGLSWDIRSGSAASLNLSRLLVVMAGSYNDDEPRRPWLVVLYVDERASPDQRQALTDIFLGRAGGSTFRNFASAIGEVYAVRPARIALDHSPGREEIRVDGYFSAKTAHIAPGNEAVTCGIPGHDRPGQEIVADHFRVNDPAIRWEVTSRCGFAVDFAYSADR